MVARHSCKILLRWAILVVVYQPFFIVNAQYDTIDGHSCFRNLKGMTESMFDLASEYPNLSSVSVIGESYLKITNSNNDDYPLPQNGYDIYGMNITASDSLHQSSSKGKMLIISGVHPRELAPPELVMRFAESLVDGYNVDSDITWLLQSTEIHFIFHVNPDGRYVTENYQDTFWRKNLNMDGKCSSSDDGGVDINRNFDYQWGDQDGASNEPCDSIYHGESPLSEPETQAVVKYAREIFPPEQRERSLPLGEDIVGVFVDVHAPGGFVFYPWGHKDAKAPDDPALQALGRKVNFFNGKWSH